LEVHNPPRKYASRVAQAAESKSLKEESFDMNRSLAFSLLAISGAWFFLLKSRSAPYKIVPASIAAARLREAWAKNHTTA
jgi:hypothetical protein